MGAPYNGHQSVGIEVQCIESFAMKSNIYQALLNIGANPHHSSRDAETLKQEIRNAVTSGDICISIDKNNKVVQQMIAKCDSNNKQV